MMSDMDQRLSDIESQRLELEDNIAKLRKSLQHWQTWDAEYEALKEELEEAADFDGDSLSRIQHDFDGELVTQKEIDEIFGRQKLRSQKQIIDVLDRRIDYVTDNIRTLSKQLDAAETQLSAVEDTGDIVGADGDNQLTEITEELDEDDNVLSYKLKRPEDSLPNIQEALKQAGVKDIPGMESHPAQPSANAKDSRKQAASQPTQPKTSPANVAGPSVPGSRITDVTETEPDDIEDVPTPQSAPSPKKGVSFAEDTKPGDERLPPTSRHARRVEQIMKSAAQQDDILTQNPIIPDDEDPEDAALRQQMLNYSMGEVGAVVAELEIEEIGSDDEDYDFEYSDLEEGEEEVDDDDDDQHGRYKGRILTADYQERMLELEKKLGVKSRFTEAAERRAADGTDDDENETGPNGEGIGRIKISNTADLTASAPSASSAPVPAVKSIIKSREESLPERPKGVRFAEELDIADEEKPVSAAAPIDKSKEDLVEPMSDLVVERSPSARPAAPPSASSSTRKPSRFKKTVAENTSSIPKGPFDIPSNALPPTPLPKTPTGPEGTTLADTLVERDTSSARPIPPDEFDESMIYDEVADEYQRMRKRFIQRDGGGFLKEDESEIQPLEEADGGPKMSRFKAARLSRQ